MILLHSYLLFKRLSLASQKTNDLSQAIFDSMFADMDKNLRELGIGDLGVSHHIKKMVRAFYGRANAYDQALLQENPSQLEKALKRNLYRNTSPSENQVIALANYVRMEYKALESLRIKDILDGEFSFNAPVSWIVS